MAYIDFLQARPGVALLTTEGTYVSKTAGNLCAAGIDRESWCPD